MQPNHLYCTDADINFQNLIHVNIQMDLFFCLVVFLEFGFVLFCWVSLISFIRVQYKNFSWF